MTIGPFAVQERPSTPLVVTVTNADGTAKDLSGYDTVDIEGLPAGVTTVADAATGRVQYTFTEAFAEAGTVRFRVVLSQADGDTDFSPWGEIQVLGDLAPRVTAGAAYAHTAQQVSVTDLVRAQAQIALVVDRDLADTEIWTGIETRDQKLLAQAISWQAVELAKTDAAGLASLPGQVQAMSTAGQSVTFATGTSLTSMTALSPVVIQVLNRISWRRRQISAEPLVDARGPMPDPWARVGGVTYTENFGLFVGTL